MNAPHLVDAPGFLVKVMNCLKVLAAIVFTLASFSADAQEPFYESEGAARSKAGPELSVPQKAWLNRELFLNEKGNYSALIWGHAAVARAMPEKFNLNDEVQELAANRLDWYSCFTPGTPSEMDRFRSWFLQTGMRVSMGFPSTSTEDEAIRLGAQPANPAMVAAGKKPRVAPIDPYYVQASKNLIEARFGANEDLRFIRSVHFQDEPGGALPYFDIGTKWRTPLTAEWEEQVRATAGEGKWGLPKDNWDTTEPEARLAYQKFWAVRYNDYQREMAKMLREKHPEIEIWSANFWFNKGSDLLWDYDEMGEFLDAVVVDSYATQQELDFPGRGRWNAGYVTKIAGDLSKKPVYNHFQAFEYKGAVPRVADIYEYASQTIRAGGMGVIYYAIDMPAYKYIRYTDPARWHALLDIANQLRALPKLRFSATTPTAFWVSQETLATTGPRVKDNSAYAAYVILGEVLGVPFRYVSDWAVARRGDAELEQFRIIYVGPATWTPENVTQRLIDWVKRGGTLVLSDPSAFTRQMAGANFLSWKEALEIVAEPQSVGEKGEEWPLGQGSIIVLQQNPWQMGAWETMPKQLDLIRRLQITKGGGIDEPIWRFRLQPTEGKPEPISTQQVGAPLIPSN